MEKKRRNAACFLLIALSAGCARLTPIHGKDGQPAYLVECGNHLPTCYGKAQEVCNGPYTTLDSGVGVAGVPTTSGGTLIAAQHHLTFRCSK